MSSIKIDRSNAISFCLKMMLLCLVLLYIVHVIGDKEIQSVYNLSFYLFIFSVFCLINKYLKQESVYIILLAVSSLIESVIVILQLFHVIDTGQSVFTVTGTFGNPGPLGGFMSVCVSVMFPYLIYSKRDSYTALEKIARYTVILALTVSLVLLPVTKSRAAMLALLLGAFVYFLKYDSIRLFVKRYCILIIVVLSFALYGAYKIRESSVNGRYLIYKIELNCIKKNALWGVGPGKWRGEFGLSQKDFFEGRINIEDGIVNIDPSVEKERMLSDVPRFPFNEFLRVGMELGIIGLLLAVMSLFMLCGRLKKINSSFFYGVIVLTVFSLFSYPFSLFFFKCFGFLCLSLAIIPISEGEIKKVPWMLVAVITILFYLSIPVYAHSKAAHYLAISRPFYQLEDYEKVVQYYSLIEDEMKDDPDYLLEYGSALLALDRIEESERLLSDCLKRTNDYRALLFWGDLCFMKNDPKQAEKYYSDAFIMVPNRVKPLEKLAELYYKTNDCERLHNLKASLDSFVPKIENDETGTMRSHVDDLYNSCLH